MRFDVVVYANVRDCKLEVEHALTAAGLPPVEVSIANPAQVESGGVLTFHVRVGAP